MRRVLITGGAGFIGSNLVAHLAAAGSYEIVVLDDESLGSLERLREHGVRAIKADILDDAALDRALEGVEIVVHLAADTRVVESIENPEKNFHVNVLGTFRLLQKARAAGVERFVNASTGGAILGEVTPPIDETMAANPASPYGASKLAAEGYCSAFHQAYGLSTISLRFSNIYGLRSWHKGSVVAGFFKRILNNEELVIFGDGSQVRDYLFAGDLVMGIERAMQSTVAGPVQLASGCPTSLTELVDLMLGIVGSDYDIRIRHEPFRAGEVRATWCDISRARDVLNFEPRTSLEDGLRRTWNWFQSAYSSK